MRDLCEEYKAIQNELQKGISLCDDFEASSLKTVAGVDLAYWNIAVTGRRPTTSAAIH